MDATDSDREARKREARRRSKRRYISKCKQVNLVFYPTEGEMARHLFSKPDKTGYIKGLIMADMRGGK